MKRIICLGMLAALTATTVKAQSVTVTNEPLTLPTYEIGQPDVNPIFYTGRVYQGAQGHIYPYPLYDVLTDNKVDKTYNAVYLENEYLKVCILPEIGGRILSATDKTDNYEIFYRQTGIKPALIGMLGAWLSGGVEWNIPHHHRMSSYMPIDWKTEENPDGSKTIWVGETEFRHRMKWSVGVTIYPDRSWVEARVKVINRTPFTQSLLYWANVSVHCNKDYEVIFPPSTQFGTDHSKVYFTRWPYGETVKGSGEDRDLSRWENYTGDSRSIFCWNFEDDFLAGYDHGKNAGTVHVANHHIVTGKKFFLWGNNPSGEMWNTMLSDNDGHYLELMVGAYSDNQPDYSWIAPGETKEFVQRWYGIRDLGQVKNANDDAAVNLERRAANKLFVGFNATAKFPNAKAIVKRGDNVVFEKQLAMISPADPFTTTITIDKTAKDEEFTAFLFDNKGNELVAYTPVVLEEKELPSVIEGTKNPADYETNEELYYAGLRIDQFHNARLKSMDFYNEALRRDPMDSRVNTAVGVRYAKQGQYELAEKHLLAALKRPTKDYTVVKEAEPHYYLGTIYQLQGRLKEAADQYWKATWTPAFQHASYFGLAQVACLQNDYTKALGLITESLNVGMRDTKALTLKAYILRKLGKTSDAAKAVEMALEVDPLDYWALAEKSMLANGNMSFLRAEQKQRGEGFVETQELIEISLDYANAGAFAEASQVLTEGIALGNPYNEAPLISYYNGYYQQQLGNETAAKQLYAKASAMSTDFSFPFRLEEINMLNAIAETVPADARVPYYLGDLYYFLEQKELGVKAWEIAVEKNNNFAQAYRNLGFAYSQNKQLQKAIATYEKAIAFNAADPRFFKELDVLYEQVDKPSAERLAVLEKNLPTVLKHDEAVMRLLTLYNETGNYDKAIALEDDRHFHVWEGGGEIHSIFTDSHLLKGMKLYEAGQYKEAIAEFDRADEYPENLEVGRPSGGGHSAKGYYYKGKSYQALGNKKQAAAAFKVASVNEQRRGRAVVSENTLYKAFSLRELGKAAEANTLLEQFTTELDKQLGGSVSVDAYSKFGEDGTANDRLANLNYLKGLKLVTEGNEAEGKALLKKAVSLKPNLIWAQILGGK